MGGHRVMNGLWPPKIEETLQEPYGSYPKTLAHPKPTATDLAHLLLKLDEEQKSFVLAFNSQNLKALAPKAAPGQASQSLRSTASKHSSTNNLQDSRQQRSLKILDHLHKLTANAEQ